MGVGRGNKKHGKNLTSFIDGPIRIRMPLEIDFRFLVFTIKYVLDFFSENG